MRSAPRTFHAQDHAADDASDDASKNPPRDNKAGLPFKSGCGGQFGVGEASKQAKPAPGDTAKKQASKAQCNDTTS